MTAFWPDLPEFDDGLPGEEKKRFWGAGADLLKSAEIPATGITEANVYTGLSPKIVAENIKVLSTLCRSLCSTSRAYLVIVRVSRRPWARPA